MDQPALPRANLALRPVRSALLSLLIVALALAAASCRTKPNITIPTPNCGAPTLKIGSGSFRIETLQPAADGSIQLPSDSAGVAYWVNGTTTNQVFLIPAAPENIKTESSLLSTINGAAATVTWQNCNSTNYTLGPAQDGAFSASPLPDQSTSGITILFQQKTPGAASVVRGALSGETITTINTPASGASGIQAEVSLLDTTTSTDGKMLRIGVSILNTGTVNIKFTEADVALISEDGSASKPVHAEPALPQTIKRNATQTIYFTFPRPSSQTATLKVLDVEYDVEGY